MSNFYSPLDNESVPWFLKILNLINLENTWFEEQPHQGFYEDHLVEI